ncbi:MAG: glycosyltransferase family 39 protein [Acidobacteria bacterium]|nr:glycosyltransferase family 39 protein [Acidobacteriota bacterium]
MEARDGNDPFLAVDACLLMAKMDGSDCRQRARNGSALRLLRGEVLYRDISYLYPPLAPYLNSALSGFGPHLDVLHCAGIICSILIVVISYSIARRILDRTGSSIAVSAIIVLCLFKPSGNLISPYAFAALYGMIFSLATLLVSLRYAETKNDRELISAGILIGLAVITKQEFGLASAITITGTLTFIYRNQWKFFIRNLLVAAIPAMLIALPVYSFLIWHIGWRTIVEDCHLFYTHLPASLVFYNSQRTGMDRPFLSILQMFGAAAVAIAALSLVVLLSDRTRKTFIRLIPVMAGSAIVIAAVAFVSGTQWDGSPLRALPLLLVAMIVYSWRKCDRNAGAALFVISVYSLAILARVSLRVPSGGAFGGYFLPASLILFCYLFTVALPRLAGHWAENEPAVRQVRIYGAAILIVTLTIMLIVFGIRFRRNYNIELIAERGHLYLPRSSGPVIKQAIDYIETSTQPGEQIAVLPEGSDIVFLTARTTALRHQIMIPGLMSDSDEQTAIALLDRNKVQYILIVNRPMREFGLEAFGRDFYTNLGGWIDAHYSTVAVFGGNGNPDIQIGDRNFFVKVKKKMITK